MTIEGAPVTWVQLLPHLLTIRAKERLYRKGVWLCRCTDGACAEVPAGACLPGGEWNVCPYGLLRSLAFRALLSFDDCARIAPLQGWPNAFPAWLTWGLIVLRKRQGDAK